MSPSSLSGRKYDSVIVPLCRTMRQSSLMMRVIGWLSLMDSSVRISLSPLLRYSPS